MELQEMFDTVVTHLLTQNKKSAVVDQRAFGVVQRVRCLYRGPNGTKCAIGILINDSDYDPIMEGVGVGDTVSGEWSPWSETGAIRRAARLDTRDKISLAYQLQCVHDKDPPEKWVKSLLEVAQKFNLNFDQLVRNEVPITNQTEVEVSS